MTTALGAALINATLLCCVRYPISTMSFKLTYNQPHGTNMFVCGSQLNATVRVPYAAIIP